MQTGALRLLCFGRKERHTVFQCLPKFLGELKYMEMNKGKEMNWGDSATPAEGLFVCSNK